MKLEKTKVLVLFPNDWDKTEFSKSKYYNEYEFFYLGNDLFSFPSYLLLPIFDVDRFISRAIKFIKSNGINAVLSSDEYIGAIIAAVIAEKINLYSSNPIDILLSQHKYLSRKMQQLHCPSAAVVCELIPQKINKGFNAKLSYPFFVKPVKGTFSLFAKVVNSEEELKQHMSFNWYERIVLKMITKPFNNLLSKYSDLTLNANYFIGEELIEGTQVTVDGFVWNGQVEVLGVVDSVMFPDTNIFERFEYPSRLTTEVQLRMQKVVHKFIKGIGYKEGQFNIEFFYNQVKDSIHIIEINPRLSYQFADLYENVDGTNTYQILLDLATGKKPTFKKWQGKFSHTASFVLRTFKGKELRTIPNQSDIDRFNNRYSEASIKIYGKVGTKLSGEMRAIGSYRYGIVNVGANSILELFAIYEDVVDSLQFSFK